MRRKRPRASRVLVFLSVLLGAFATLVLRGHLARLEARAEASGPGEPVVVIVGRLERGTVLAPGMVAVDEMPARYAPPGALSSVDQATGHTLAADMAPGETLTSVRLAPPGGPVASLVPDGLRAVPVNVELPPGAVSSGDRVDVLATYATGRPYTEAVVSAAEVLTVLATNSPDVPGSATALLLLVDPEAAERLAHARTFADLSVAVAPPSEVPS
jgi:Flp pilus assembly protein CpaB